MLETDVLCYYTSADEYRQKGRPKPKGVISLLGSFVQTSHDPLGFKLLTPKRTYAFKAETLSEAQARTPCPSPWVACNNASTRRQPRLAVPCTTSHAPPLPHTRPIDPSPAYTSPGSRSLRSTHHRCVLATAPWQPQRSMGRRTTRTTVLPPPIACRSWSCTEQGHGGIYRTRRAMCQAAEAGRAACRLP